MTVSVSEFVASWMRSYIILETVSQEFYLIQGYEAAGLRSWRKEIRRERYGDGDRKDREIEIDREDRYS